MNEPTREQNDAWWCEKCMEYIPAATFEETCSTCGFPVFDENPHADNDRLGKENIRLHEEIGRLGAEVQHYRMESDRLTNELELARLALAKREPEPQTWTSTNITEAQVQDTCRPICPHGRYEGQPCPHCLGVSGA